MKRTVTPRVFILFVFRKYNMFISIEPVHYTPFLREHYKSTGMGTVSHHSPHRMNQYLTAECPLLTDRSPCR